MLDRSLAELLESLPDDALVPVGWLRGLAGASGAGSDGTPTVSPPGPAETWRTRLWSAPGDSLLGVDEVAEALGRPRSFVYRAASRKADPLVATRLDGALSFRAADVRAWVTRRGRASRGESLDSPSVSIASRRREGR